MQIKNHYCCCHTDLSSPGTSCPRALKTWDLGDHSSFDALFLQERGAEGKQLEEHLPPICTQPSKLKIPFLALQEPWKTRAEISQDRVEQRSCFLSNCCATNPASLFMFPVQFIILLLLQCAQGGISKLCHTELPHGKPGWKAQFLLCVELGLQKPGANYTQKWSKSLGWRLKMNLWVAEQRSPLKEEAELSWNAFIQSGATWFSRILLSTGAAEPGHCCLAEDSKHFSSLNIITPISPKSSLFLIQQPLSSRPHEPEGRGWEIWGVDPQTLSPQENPI